MKILVVIPACNEQSRIGPIVEQVCALGYDVVVIDDGSTDDTQVEAAHAGARVVSHRIGLGYGAALETGFHFALRHDYDTVVTLDGDGQHDPGSIPDLLSAMKGGAVDMVLGSRELGRKNGLMQESQPFVRKLGQTVLSKVASMMSRQNFTDPTTGYLALGRRSLEFLSKGQYPHDYPDADVLVMMARAGFSFAEVPIAVRSRAGGESMHGGLKPLYYMFKMTISLMLTPLRGEEAQYHS